MNHEHKHDHCPHLNVKYCSHCDVVYCKDCGREWGTKYNWYYYPYTTTPYWVNTNGNISYNISCNHT